MSLFKRSKRLNPLRLTEGSASEGIQRRLIRVFALQALLVSAATMLGVWAAYVIAEQVLVRQALESEAIHFWKMREASADFQLPDTSNMRGYLQRLEPRGRADQSPFLSDAGSALANGVGALPEELTQLEPGYGRVTMGSQQPLVLVSDLNGQRLFLVFREDQVSKLAFFFGVAPLSLVLIMIYTASWFTFRQSQAVVSPVSRLAAMVGESARNEARPLGELIQACTGENADIDRLVQALTHYSERIAGFIERERNFTRDASHELRTPLSVIKACVDVLQQPGTNAERHPELIERIRDTSIQMEEIITTLLRLARESDAIRTDAVSGERTLVDLGELIASVVGQARKAQPGSEVRVCVDGASVSGPKIMAEETALRIIFGNLLKNSLTYARAGASIEGSDGCGVRIAIHPDRVVISDAGIGMSASQMQQAFEPYYRAEHQPLWPAGNTSGYGLGLSIAKGLCKRFGYQLDAHSAEGEGTTMIVRFS